MKTYTIVGISIIVLAMICMLSPALFNFRNTVILSQCRARFEELESFLDHKMITTLTFEQSESLTWKKGEKEIEWNDMLYDVIDVKYKGTKVIIRCVQDRVEYDIVRSFQSILNSRGDQQNVTQYNFVDLKYIFPSTAFLQIDSMYGRPNHYFKWIEMSINSIDITIPPPDFS